MLDNRKHMAYKGFMNLMAFSNFKTRELAEKVGCSHNYLRQIRCGMRRPSFRLAKDIEIATEGQIKATDLRPDLADYQLPLE